MIDDEKIEAALAYLASNVEASAEARANKVFMVEGRKVKKAQLMNQSNEPSEAAKERFAYSHEEYQDHLEALKQAIYEDAKHEFRRAAYNATIDSWRTQNANIRAAEKVT
jgi:hypothetical protein